MVQVVQVQEVQEPVVREASLSLFESLVFDTLWSLRSGHVQCVDWVVDPLGGHLEAGSWPAAC